MSSDESRRRSAPLSRGHATGPCDSDASRPAGTPTAPRPAGRGQIAIEAPTGRGKAAGMPREPVKPSDQASHRCKLNVPPHRKELEMGGPDWLSGVPPRAAVIQRVSVISEDRAQPQCWASATASFRGECPARVPAAAADFCRCASRQTQPRPR